MSDLLKKIICRKLMFLLCGSDKYEEQRSGVLGLLLLVAEDFDIVNLSISSKRCIPVSSAYRLPS